MNVEVRVEDRVSAAHPESSHDIIVLRLAGEIDAEGAAMLGTAVSGALTQFPARIHLDLADVSMLGVRGLEALRAAGDRCLAHRVRLSVVNVPDWIDRVFEMTDSAATFDHN